MFEKNHSLEYECLPRNKNFSGVGKFLSEKSISRASKSLPFFFLDSGDTQLSCLIDCTAKSGKVLNLLNCFKNRSKKLKINCYQSRQIEPNTALRNNSG